MEALAPDAVARLGGASSAMRAKLHGDGCWPHARLAFGRFFGAAPTGLGGARALYDWCQWAETSELADLDVATLDKKELRSYLGGMGKPAAGKLEVLRQRLREAIDERLAGEAEGSQLIYCSIRGRQLYAAT